MQVKILDNDQLLKAISLLTEKQVIEFGDGIQAGHMTGIRIRLIPTHSGLQFGIHRINSLGQQGSGFYTTMPADAFAYAVVQQHDYMRPLPAKLQERLCSKIKRPDMQWALFTIEDREQFKLMPL